MDTTETRGFLNDAQRKALADIVVRRFDQRIALADEKTEEILRQIEKTLARPFDVEKIDVEIKRFRGLVDSMEARKRDLGLVQTLSARRDAIEQAVWLAATVEEAQRLVASIDVKEAA